VRHPPEADDDIRLFCCAGAGGSSITFGAWQAAFGPGIRVVPLELPGHGRRLREPPLRRLPALLDELFPSVAARAGDRWALFGHSMGSLIATELCRRLEAAGRRGHLFVAAGRPPHLIRPGRTLLHRDSDERVIAHLRRLNGTPPELLANREFAAVFLPAIRADLEVLETYRHPEPAPPPLACPITAFAGSRDPIVGRETLDEWRHHTAGGFALHVVDGDHFFMRSGDMLATIATTLAHAA